MKKNKLRQQAEERLGKQKTAATSTLDADTQALIHELRVHQIELEMQNEELVQARAEAEAVRRLYTDLYDFAPVGYFTLARDGAINKINFAGAALLGVERDQLIKRRLGAFVPAQSLKTLNTFFDRVFTSGENETCDIEFLKDGAAPLWTHIEAVTDSDEHEMCRVVVVDISERKQAEAELMESKGLIDTVVENIPLMIFLKEATDLRFVIFNRAGEELLGYDRQAFLGKNNLDLFPPEQAAHFMAKDREVLNGEAGLLDIPEEPILTAKKGQRLLHTHKVCIRGADGNTKYLLGISEDITERKQAEQKLQEYSEHLEERVTERTRELREAQEQLVLKEKLAVLGQLAGGVGHELRNPLGVINSAIYYLKMVQPDADDKVLQYHVMIEQEVHNAEKIINDLLDFARGISADRETVSVPELVQSVLIRFPAPPSVDVTLKLSADLPKVFADPRQMEQVLGNLTTNACQAMANGGKLTITAHVLGPVPERDLQKEFVVIAVNDTGTGIPPENMQKIFEPLFTTKAKGIGLGLAVSKKLVEANSGRIEVQSEPGKGSTFTVYLPIQNK